MGTYKRLPREKEKFSAEMYTWLEHAHQWFNVNWRLVLAGIGSVALLAVVVIAISSFMGGRDEKAKEMFYSAGKLAPGSDDQVAAYNKVISSYPRTGVAEVARLKLGDLYYAKGDYQKAIDSYMPVAKSGDSLLKIAGMHNVAAAKLANKDAAGAAEEYLKAYKDPKNMTKGISYYNAALAYLEAGKSDEAKQIFTALAKDDAVSTPELKEKSKEQLIWLAATTK